MLVLATTKDKPELVYVTLVPVMLFYVLDFYYFGFEKAFRVGYNDFVKKLHSGDLEAGDLYLVAPTGSMFSHRTRPLTLGLYFVLGFKRI